MEEATVTETAEEENPQEEQSVEEPVSPMDLEGKQEHEPPPEHPRFKEVYGNWKDVERKLEAANAELAGLKAKPAEEPKEEVQAAPPPPPKQEPEPEPKTAELELELAKLKTDMKQAMKDLDGERQAELFDKIEDVRDKLIVERQSVSPTKISQAVRDAEIRSAGDEFIGSHDWIRPYNSDGSYNTGYDSMMAGAAKELEVNMAPTWNGSYSSLLAEIGRRVEARFTPAQAAKPKVPVVQGVDVVKGAPAKKEVKLTDEQRRAAHGMLGHLPNPEEAYVEQLKKQGVLL
jgi:hypothetical protein